MKQTIVPPLTAPVGARGRGALSRAAAGVLDRRLDSLQGGAITLIEGGQTRRFGVSGELEAVVRVLDPAFYLDLALGGGVGAAESYIQGRWECDELTELIRIFARNLDAADALDAGWARFAQPLLRAAHWLRRNTVDGSRRNIHAHYDLGDDFFEMFLDPTMSYSAALFPSPAATLEQAQVAKMDRICRKLDLQAGDRLLEIGTGWGALAIHAASCYGCRVTTTTISQRQFERASERVREEGLQDRVTVLNEDYRRLTGGYDKIASVEMIEAVGHAYLETFFGCCGRLLRPDGLMLLQGITIGDHRYESYRRSVDFIRRYVFPGSCLPSVTALCQAISRSSDLRPSHLEEITPHYAETLRRWRARFAANRQAILDLGYADSFLRLWTYYLCYCEAGFEEGVTGDIQLLLAKPRRRRETTLELFPGGSAA